MEKIDMTLRKFYLTRFDQLFANINFRNKILSCNDILKVSNTIESEHEVFKKVFMTYVGEAELTLSLLAKQKLTKEHTLLEIGGGIGLVYGFLKSRGFCIYALEPSASGHDGYYETALEMFHTLGISSDHWYPFLAEECGKINEKFDIIFSNYVLEHIQNLEASFRAMKSVLKSNGVMIHHTVNYIIPYEPHFKIVLPPFFPRLASFFKPMFKESPLWNGLNFVTVGKLKGICQSCNLEIEFGNGIFLETMRRLDTDSQFANRHKYFLPIYRFLKWTHLLHLVDVMPIWLTTPIRCIIRKPKYKK